MAQIQVTDLTFCYVGSFDNIFENVTFGIDTDWKLGFIGRNGKGKTTFAKLLSGKYEYRGVITAPNLHFDYFPYQVEEADFDKPASELMEFWKGDIQEWRVMCELNQRPRCKQRGIKLAALQSSGVFDPRGSRQISMQAWLLGSLLAGIKNVRKAALPSFLCPSARPLFYSFSAFRLFFSAMTSLALRTLST